MSMTQREVGQSVEVAKVAEIPEGTKRTGDIISDIDIRTLKTYKVSVVGDAVHIERE
jgi:hypothetical protein